MIDDWTPDTLSRFRTAVREALSNGDRDRFDEVVNAVSNAPIPPVYRERETPTNRKGRETIRPADLKETWCGQCGATYVGGACGYCRRQEVLGDG